MKPIGEFDACSSPMYDTYHLGAYEKGQYSLASRWLHWQKCHVILQKETEDSMNECGVIDGFSSTVYVSSLKGG